MKMIQSLVFVLFAFCGFICVNAQSTEGCCPCPATPQCKGGWEPWNGHCYAFIKGGATWYEARDACLHLGGHLVKIGTEYENDFIVGSIKANNMEKPWIGLRKIVGRWQWTDETSFLYTDWNTGEPSGDGNCVQIRDDLEYHWNDEPCLRKNGYICEQD